MFQTCIRIAYIFGQINISKHEETIKQKMLLIHGFREILVMYNASDKTMCQKYPKFDLSLYNEYNLILQSKRVLIFLVDQTSFLFKITV